MQKILVTGANGFIGSHIVKHLLRKKYHVIATGRSESRIPFQDPHLEYKLLDFTEPAIVANIIDDVKPNIIVHSGAMASPDMCEQKKEDAYLTNVLSTFYLLKAAAKINSHFIYLSTDFVFDGKVGCYNEEDERGPVNYYGHTKCMAEDLVKGYPFKWTIARTAMVYGKVLTTKENFISLLVKQLKEGHRQTIFVDQVRTFTYVEDLAKGIQAVIDKRAAGVYHLAGPDTYTLFDAAIAAAEYLQLDKNLVMPIQENDILLPAIRPKKGGLNIAKAVNELGYHPLSYLQGLKVTFGLAEVDKHLFASLDSNR